MCFNAKTAKTTVPFYDSESANSPKSRSTAWMDGIASVDPDDVGRSGWGVGRQTSRIRGATVDGHLAMLNRLGHREALTWDVARHNGSASGNVFQYLYSGGKRGCTSVPVLMEGIYLSTCHMCKITIPRPFCT